MKSFKKTIPFALAAVILCAACITAWMWWDASTAPSNMQISVNLTDVYDHPENFPNTELIIHKDVQDYISALNQDENLSDEARNALISDAMENSISSTAYLTLRQNVPVTRSYSAYPYFYILYKYSDAGKPEGILEVKSASLDRSHKNKTKQFSGNLYYHLGSSTYLYWDLNGDFYNNGSTAVSNGPGIAIGEQGASSFSVSDDYTSDGYVQQSCFYRL